MTDVLYYDDQAGFADIQRNTTIKEVIGQLKKESRVTTTGRTIKYIGDKKITIINGYLSDCEFELAEGEPAAIEEYRQSRIDKQ